MRLKLDHIVPWVLLDQEEHDVHDAGLANSVQDLCLFEADDGL